MPEIEMEVPIPLEPPILKLPGSGTFSVIVTAQIAKHVAGCYICSRPIPVGSSRLNFWIRMPNVMDDLGNMVSPDRKTQRYNVHPGCLTKVMGSEIKRHFDSCWDCGMNVESTGVAVFSGIRHGFSRLCTDCQKLPKWKQCDNCAVFYPHQLVWPGRIDGASTNPFASLDRSTPMVSEGMWCTFCAERFNVKTAAELKSAAEEFEATRQAILAGNLWDD